MSTIDTLVIGAGQAGLAVSRCLADTGVEHAVLERGRVAERWLSERWDSLRLLTPNWASRLPGWHYRGSDPSGYMTATEFARYLDSYARSFEAPVQGDTAVQSVRGHSGCFEVRTDRGTWRAAHVVLATGWCDTAHIPEAAGRLSPRVAQLDPATYRRPDALPDGGVLIVGASASGVQLADELARSGRDVVLSVGRHNRVPRQYRGMDIWWWLERTGTFDKTIDQVRDPERARREGALQLVGRPDRRNVDLATLQGLGVRLAGRFAHADREEVTFLDDLAQTTGAADAHLRRVLAGIDAHIAAAGLEAEVFAPEPQGQVHAGGAIERLDLAASGISTVVWATGYRRPYPWLQVPVLDAHGEIRQRRGVTPVPGLYVMGQRFQHRRSSNFIDGVRHDAAYVSEHLARSRQLRRLAS
jgi:putative flavoprotein involved in K+ transport